MNTSLSREEENLPEPAHEKFAPAFAESLTQVSLLLVSRLPVITDRSETKTNLEELVERMVILSVHFELSVDVKVLSWLPAVSGSHVGDTIEKLVVLSGLLQTNTFPIVSNVPPFFLSLPLQLSP